MLSFILSLKEKWRKATNPKIKTMASQNARFPSHRKMNSRIVEIARNINPDLILPNPRLNDRVDTANIPITSAIFVIFEPMTLPATIAVSPLRAAAILEANSGNEVPKATKVTPIINGEIPIFNPITSADSMNQSDPLIRTKRLSANSDIYSKVSISEFLFEAAKLRKLSTANQLSNCN